MTSNILKFSKSINSNIFRNLCTSATISSEPEKLVLIDVNDKTGYGTLSMNRLPANSLNVELLSSLSNALDEMEKNKSRGVILTSASQKIFSAGADISIFCSQDARKICDFWSAAQDCALKFYEAPFPSAAAINGHAVAGGCFFAMSCDYRAMMKGFQIGINEAVVGIAVPKVIVMLMSKLLPRRHAEVAMTQGILYSPEDAQKINLVDETVNNKAEAISKCEAFLDQYKNIPTEVVRATKRNIRREEIEYLRNNKTKDIEEFLKSIENVEAQNKIKMYYQALKNKK